MNDKVNIIKSVSILMVVTIVFAVVGCGQKVVDAKKMVQRGGLMYELNSEEPFTGLVVGYYSNGQKQVEVESRAGKTHGKGTMWHENGQKMSEGEYRDGEEISVEWWDEDGNPTLSPC